MVKPAVDIAVLGGAFDPPHLGHVFMAMAAVRSGFAGSVWLMPCPDRPDKVMARPFRERLELVEVAISQTPPDLRTALVASDFEHELGQFRGSLSLMRKLEESFPQKTFGFLMGGDTLENIVTWNDPLTGELTGQCFLESFACCVFARAGDGEQKLPERVHPRSRRLSDLDDLVSSLGLALDPAIEGGDSSVASDSRRVLGQQHCYAEISSTRIRKELASAHPDREYLSWALGPRVRAKLESQT